MTKKFHPYHLVEKSPWPLLASLSAFFLMLSVLIWVNLKTSHLLLISFFSILLVAFCWWHDIFSESLTQGNHSLQVTVGIQAGMILFIVSEVFFFSSFFWAFFHSSVSPTTELGQMWPPHNIVPFNPINIPLLNTLLLISSGVSVTWCHHSLLLNNKLSATVALNTTVLLGILFSLLQAFEYQEASFSISDSAFGSAFFMATGFHGLHVLIGTTFLIVAMQRLTRMSSGISHITSFECAAWYWHFVDVVWLFLYLNLYWWGS